MQETDLLGWTVNSQNGIDYTKTVQSFLDSEELFRNFRRGDQSYTNILEHLTEGEGKIYLDYILKHYPHLLEKFTEFERNDLVGNPVKFNYINGISINPTTLRYIKFVGDIEKRFGNLDGYNLVEIGGGYGGLVRVLSSVNSFKSIKLFDLPEVVKLQSKYLSRYGIDAQTYTLLDEFKIDSNTVVVSNYAWCECNTETRQQYYDRIISKCDKVFIVHYGVDTEHDLMELQGKKEVEKEVLDDCKIFSLSK